MNLSELVRLIADIAEIAVTVMVAYAVYKVAIMIDKLSDKLTEGNKP